MKWFRVTDAILESGLRCIHTHLPLCKGNFCREHHQLDPLPLVGLWGQRLELLACSLDVACQQDRASGVTPVALPTVEFAICNACKADCSSLL